MIHQLKVKIYKSYLLGLICATLFLPLHVSVSGFVIRPFDILFLSYLLCYFFPIRKNKLKSFFANRLIICSLLFFSYQILSALVLNNDAFLKTLVQNVEYVLLLFFIYRITVRETKRWKFLKGFLTLSFLLVASTAIWHIYHGYFVGYKQLNDPKLLFGLVSVFMVCRYIIFKKNSLLLVLSLLLTLFSLERKGWVGLIFALALIMYFLIIKFNKGSQFVKFISFGILFAIISVTIVSQLNIGNQIFKQISDTFSTFEKVNLQKPNTNNQKGNSNAERLYLLYFSYQTFRSHPIIGIGTEAFKDKIQEFTPSGKNWLVHGAHNQYQKILVENGAIGFLLYLLILAIVFLRLKQVDTRFLLSKNSQYCYLLIAGIYAYCSLVNLFLGGGASNIFFFVLPLALIISFRKENYRKKIERKRLNIR